MEKLVYAVVAVRVPSGMDPDDFLDELEFKAVNINDNEDYLMSVDATFEGVPKVVTKRKELNVENDWACPECKSVSLCILNEYSDGVENVYKVECQDCNKKFFVSEKSK